MPRYFFHICNGTGFVEDEQGLNLPDQETAYKKAVEAARGVMADDMRKGELDLTSFVEVEDEARTLLLTLTFAEAVTMRRDHVKDRPRRDEPREIV
jgi:hypothetical protein